MRFNGFLRECLKQGTPSLCFSGLVLKFFQNKKKENQPGSSILLLR